MKGRYEPGSRRVLSGNGYKLTVTIIVAIAVALVLLLLVFLPATEDEQTLEKTIVSISAPSKELGLNVDKSQIYMTVTYSDGSSDKVALSDMISSGLDLGSIGVQNVSLNYGGFEQTVVFEIMDADCVLNYQASLGGYIQGEQQQTVPNGGTADTVIAVPETGYVFDKWEDGYPESERKDTGVTQDATHLAIFKKNKYTVIFYYPDETVAVEETVSYGEAPTKAPNPDSDPRMQVYGYTFSNWIPSDFSKIDRDMIIRPEYIKTSTDVNVDIPADIYGNTMGSTDAADCGFYPYDQVAAITATPYNSRQFHHWLIQTSDGSYTVIDKESTKTVNVGGQAVDLSFTSTKSGAEDYILSFTPNEDINKINIKAVFAYSKSTIWFINNLSDDGNFNFELNYGDPLSEMISDTTIFDEDIGPGNVIGFKFIGWYAVGDTDGEKVLSSDTFTQPTQLVAKWEKLTYEIRFLYENEGYETIDEKVYVKYQNTFASASKDEAGMHICGIPAVKPQYDRYVFVGWKNSITDEMIDDKTKVVVHNNYLDSNGDPKGDFAKRKITLTPVFKPIEHRIVVNIMGSGLVNSIVDNNYSGKRSVSGILDIVETKQYKFEFLAFEGYALKSLTSTFNGVSSVFNFDDNEDNFLINIDERGDTVIAVEFQPKTYDITIELDQNIGSIQTDADYLNDGTHFTVTGIRHNDSVIIDIKAVNAEYVIEKITVDNAALLYDNGNYQGADSDFYTLTLPEVKNDINIKVFYKANEHTVFTPEFSSGTPAKNGEIVIADFYDKSKTTAISDNKTVALNNTYINYRISAKEIGYAVKEIMFNGFTYDLYNSGSNNILFHNWYINGVNIGIELLQINEQYIYNYGGFSYGGHNYIMAQDLSHNAVVFEKTEQGGGYVYTAINDNSVIEEGKKTVDFANRNIFDTLLSKDNRITQLDILLCVDKNYIIDADFAPMQYKISVTESTLGEVVISRQTTQYGGNSSITVTPIAGYNVTAYKINDNAEVPIIKTVDNASFSLKFEGVENIKEDKHISFVYEKIRYTVTFKNSNIKYNVYVDGIMLNASKDFILDYKESKVFSVTIDGGYRINKIKINSAEQNIHFNMQSYNLAIVNIAVNNFVEIGCAEISDDPIAGDTYRLTAADTAYAEVSFEKPICLIDEENTVRFSANTGYYISGYQIIGYPELNVTYSENDKVFGELTLVAGLFETGENVTFVISTAKKEFDLTTEVVQEGVKPEDVEDLAFIKRQAYGNNVVIDIKSIDNYYIKSFKIDGEQITKENAAWLSLTENSYKKQTGGKFSLHVNKASHIYLEYAINEYNVILDANSINGGTYLSSYSPLSGITNTDITTIKHGETLIIAMEAFSGYHIDSLKINNSAVKDLELSSLSPNNNIGASYSLENIDGDVYVYAVYSINRYSFVYEIKNLSANFADFDTNPGTLTTESGFTFNADKRRYEGIANGRDFYINILPAILNGYYLVSIDIIYDGSVTVQAGEGKQISASGGIIYFNTMMNFRSGVTKDIELIRLNFDKKKYSVNLEQISEDNTGKLSLTYEHPNNRNRNVVLFDGDNELYYAIPANDQTKIYKKSGGVFVDSGLVYKMGEDGLYHYYDENKEVSLFVEHGIRYAITCTPALGYKRSSFILNNKEINDTVMNNVYSTNIVRDIVAEIKFEILIYNINFQALVADKNLTGKISDDNVYKYASISVIDITDSHNEIRYDLQNGSSVIDIDLCYGTKIKFVMNSEFITTGYYLHSLYYNEFETKQYVGDVHGEAVYGGDGIELNADISVTANFRIEKYNIITEIDYNEDIVGESANRLVNESKGTVAWGDTAYIKIESGEGYQLTSLYVKRGQLPAIGVNLNPSEEQQLNDAEVYFKNKRNPATNEVRDVLEIKTVKTDLNISGLFERKTYQVRFIFNNKQYIDTDKMSFSLNKPDYIYPYKDTFDGVWVQNEYLLSDIKHYDELSGTITPVNGYAIEESYLTFNAMRYDELNEKYVAVLDSLGQPVTYTLAMEEADDGIYFTFHEDDKLLPEFYVQNVLFVNLTVMVKRYTVNTKIDRTSADSNVVNNTSVIMDVKTQTNQSVRVDNLPQGKQTFTPDYQGKIYIAEHHGKITYSFDVPEGYMLTYLSINGKIWDKNDFACNGFTERNNMLEEILQYEILKEETGVNSFYYSYILTMGVKDELLEGGEGYVPGVGEDLNIIIKIELIDYEINGIINGTEYQSIIVDGKKAFSDSKTIDVLTSDSIRHYEDLIIVPELYEGYKITDLYLAVMIDGVLTDINYPFTDTETKRININNINFQDFDVTKDNLEIYICYKTEIKKYEVNIAPEAYSIELFDNGTYGKPEFESLAGKVEVSAFKDGVRTTNIIAPNYFEYFTVITAVATANNNYAITAIEEMVGGTWQNVVNGEHGVTIESTVLPNGKTQYTFSYIVNDIGNRQFRITYRQQITAKINVINPYRFQTTVGGKIGVGNMSYIYYPEIIAKVGGVTVKNELKTTGLVIEDYEYKVYVGRNLSLSFKNNGQLAGDDFGIYYIENGQYVKNTEITTETGYAIEKEWQFYLVDNTKLYLTYEKQTNSALSSSKGGSVYFGLGDGGISNTEGSLSIYNQATATQKIQMRIVPNDYYYYYGIQIRQIDNSASAAQGKIIFKNGSDEWLNYNSDNFNELDSNGSTIKKLDNTVYPTYEITMNSNLEIRIIFYKIYDFSYAAYYSDTGDSTYYKYGYDAPQTDGLVTLTDNTVYDNLLDYTNAQISYGSYFTLEVPEPDSNYYQFVGWYVNGTNTYKYLDRKFPDSGRLTNGFEVNKNGLTLAKGDMELNKIEIVAVFQRIIDVNIINELFYYEYSDGQIVHWNSWETGSVRSQYYEYSGAQNALSITPSANNLTNLTADTVADTLNEEFYTKIQNYGNAASTWNTLKSAKEKYMNGGVYNEDNCYVYSANVNYKVLHQTITNDDYVNNTWKGGTIELLLLGLPNTVRLQSWQYYNWITGTYDEINYRYVDPSGLLDSEGNPILITNANPEYILSLDYLFSGEMQGALANENNELCPLIIRPFMRKVISINLEKLVYIDRLSGDYEEYFSSQVSPTIDSTNIVFIENNNFANTGDPYQYTENGYGEYDYGARITIRSYVNKDTETKQPIYTDNANQKYRFLGWQYQWKVNNIVSYRYLIDMEKDVNKAGEEYQIQLYFDYGEVPPTDDTIKYRALYIYQYEHDIYTYNIAGGKTYAEAKSNGVYAYMNAPVVNPDSLLINTDAVRFDAFDKSKTGNDRQSSIDIPYGYNMIEPIAEDKFSTLFYVDVGCNYSFDLDNSDKCNVDDYVANNSSSNVKGYDKDYDKQYAIIMENNGEINTDMYDYYESRQFLGANSNNSYIQSISVDSDMQLDIQYVSYIMLEFTNLMYGSGITLPVDLSRYITEGKSDAITIWDIDNYCEGDSTVNDGTVRIRIPLDTTKPISVSGSTLYINNMYGEFKYALKGYKNGKGISALKNIVYYLDNNTTLEDTLRSTNNGDLFAPSSNTYRRRIVIDYDQQINPYIDGGTLLFGNPEITGTDKYKVSNTGDGTRSSPYKIYNVRQLQNINMFWYYNEFSCNVSEVEKTVFQLFSNLNLQGISYKSCSNTNYVTREDGTVSTQKTDAWIPICYSAYGEEIKGFDGMLLGGNKSIYGIAVEGGSNGNLVPSDPGTLKEYELYDYTHGYGIFGHIGGGQIENLNIGNAYMNITGLQSAQLGNSVAKYVGILAATANDAVINNITLEENEVIGRILEGSENIRIKITANNSSYGVGALFGQVTNSVLDTITLALNNTAKVGVRIQGNNAGGIIGTVGNHTDSEGNEGDSIIDSLKVINSSASSNYLTIIGKTSSGGVFGSINEKDSVITNTVFNRATYQTVRAMIHSDKNAGGIVGQILSGTLKNSVFISNGFDSSNEYGGVVTAPISGGDLTTTSGNAGGFAGYNNGIIINSTKTKSTDGKPYNYTYVTDAIQGSLRMLATRVGGVAGENGTKGEIHGMLLNYSSATSLVLDMPFNTVGLFQTSGIRGGIVGYNQDGGLINDCSYGGADSTAGYFIKVYDSNMDTSTDVPARWVSSEKYAVKVGTLYVGGIAGLTSGAIYNSYVKNSNMFVKYYNGISDMAYDWNLHIGGIAGAQSVAKYTVGNISSNSDKDNLYDLESYIIYDWYQYNGELTSDIAKSFAKRSRIQSCFTENVKIRTIITLWCDNNSYQGVPEEGEEEANSFTGAWQGVSIGGIVGSNSQLSGLSSVNTCYAYGVEFNTYIGAYGDNRYTDNQYRKDYGWFKESVLLGTGHDYYRNRAGTRLAVNIRSIVGGLNNANGDTDGGSTASYCWSGNNNVSGNLQNTGTLDWAKQPIEERAVGGDDDFSSSESYAYKRGIDLWGHNVMNNDEQDISGTSGVYILNSEIRTMGSYINNRVYNANGDFPYYASDKCGGTVGFISPNKRDGRIYKTNYENGLLMVWHPKFETYSEVTNVEWYMKENTPFGWNAQGYAYDLNPISYANFVADSSQMSYYLVRGQSNKN